MAPKSLLGRTIDALGPKKVAALWNFSLGYVYALARDPADPEHPDNTGTERDPLTRLVGLLESLSTYPILRPVLLEWKLFFQLLFERLLHRTPDAACDDTLIMQAGGVAKETGEAVCATLSRAVAAGDWDIALREVLEARDQMDGLAAMLMRRRDQDDRPQPQLRRVP